MQVAADTHADNVASKQPRHSPCRWLQFRLRSLLLIPLLFGPAYIWSDQVYDHLMFLLLTFGAVFGAIWAMGEMESSPPAIPGLRRVRNVAWAAAGGGFLGGSLAGPGLILISIWRAFPAWALHDNQFRVMPVPYFSELYTAAATG